MEKCIPHIRACTNRTHTHTHGEHKCDDDEFNGVSSVLCAGHTARATKKAEKQIYTWWLNAARLACAQNGIGTSSSCAIVCPIGSKRRTWRSMQHERISTYTSLTAFLLVGRTDPILTFIAIAQPILNWPTIYHFCMNYCSWLAFVLCSCRWIIRSLSGLSVWCAVAPIRWLRTGLFSFHGSFKN